jgi:outer membrane biogenesis lipoprotein LolB
MALRLLLALAVLLLSSCTNDPNKKAAIDEIDRRHTEDVQRMGGGGSGGGSM